MTIDKQELRKLADAELPHSNVIIEANELLSLLDEIDELKKSYDKLEDKLIALQQYIHDRT